MFYFSCYSETLGVSTDESVQLDGGRKIVVNEVNSLMEMLTCSMYEIKWI